MQICCAPNDDKDLPISRTISVADEDESSDGTSCVFYPHCFLLESGRCLSPGMGESLTFYLSEIARVRLGLGIVSGVRAKECGVEFPYGSAYTSLELIPCATEVSAVDHADVSRVRMSPTLPADDY